MRWLPSASLDGRAAIHVWHAVSEGLELVCDSKRRVTEKLSKVALRKLKAGTFTKCQDCVRTLDPEDGPRNSVIGRQRRRMKTSEIMYCGCGCGHRFLPGEGYGCYATIECAYRYDPKGIRWASAEMRMWREMGWKPGDALEGNGILRR
jgi:hypothetical protein